jgi:hypothetical protein
VAVLKTLDVVEDFLDETFLLFVVCECLNWLLNTAGWHIEHVKVLTKQEERLFPFVLSQVLHKFTKLR